MDYTQRMRALREDKDIAQKVIADYLKIPQTTYSGYESGNRKLPVDLLSSIARYNGTSADYILGLTDEIRPYPRLKGRKGHPGKEG